MKSSSVPRWCLQVTAEFSCGMEWRTGEIKSHDMSLTVPVSPHPGIFILGLPRASVLSIAYPAPSASLPPAAWLPPTAGLPGLLLQTFSPPALTAPWLVSQWPAEKVPELANQKGPELQTFSLPWKLGLLEYDGLIASCFLLLFQLFLQLVLPSLCLTSQHLFCLSPSRTVQSGFPSSHSSLAGVEMRLRKCLELEHLPFLKFFYFLLLP